MKNFKQIIINEKSSVIDALIIINNNPKQQTLFIVDDNNKLVGTLTDGDIRRGFIKGNTLESCMSDFMLQDCVFLEEGNYSVKDIVSLRNKSIKLVPVVNKYGEIIKVLDLYRLKSVLPLECMIMAGGKGERLRPLTEKTPKPLLKLGDKPIIEHNIDRLIEYGIEKIYISVKYLGDQIKDYFGDGASKGVSIEYVEETKFLGTGGALRLVEDFKQDHILLMNSDLFTDIDFEDLYLKTIEEDAFIGIASTPYTVSIPYAILDREDNRVLSFKEKPNNTHYANAGIYILKRELIDRIPKNEFYNITDLIQDVLDRGELVIQNPIYGYWIDIGKHEDYRKAMEIVKHLPR